MEKKQSEKGGPTAQPSRGPYHGKRYRTNGEDTYRVHNTKVWAPAKLKRAQPNEFRERITVLRVLRP